MYLIVTRLFPQRMDGLPVAAKQYRGIGEGVGGRKLITGHQSRCVYVGNPRSGGGLLLLEISNVNAC